MYYNNCSDDDDDDDECMYTLCCIFHNWYRVMLHAADITNYSNAKKTTMCAFMIVLGALIVIIYCNTTMQ